MSCMREFGDLQIHGTPVASCHSHKPELYIDQNCSSYLAIHSHFYNYTVNTQTLVIAKQYNSNDASSPKKCYACEGLVNFKSHDTLDPAGIEIVDNGLPFGDLQLYVDQNCNS